MSKDLQEMLERARRNVDEIDAAEANRRLQAGQGTVLLDVREDEEWQRGHIAGAVHLPMSRLHQVEQVLPDKVAPVIVYCAVGTRSLLAADHMKSLGYSNPVSMAGGIFGWDGQGLPVDH